MSHQRRHRYTSNSSSLLIQDIDEEFEGWSHYVGDEEDENPFPPVTENPPDVIRSGGETPKAVDPAAEHQGDADAFEPPDTEEEPDESGAEEDGYDDLILRLAGGEEVDPESTEDGISSLEWSWDEIDEFDPSDDADAEDDTSPAILHYSPERIALHEKAQRAAAKILKDATWDPREGLPVLTEILILHHCHAKTISALRKLVLEVQVEPEMLNTLHEIRSAWRAHGYNRTITPDPFTRQREANEGWLNLPWGMALHIIESLGVQSASEVMGFIEICFTDWCEIGFDAFPIFAYYLNFVLSTVDAPFGDTVHTAPAIARAMLTDRGEQYDLHGSPTHLELNALGVT